MLDEGARLRFQLDRFGDYLTLEQGTSPLTLEAYRRDVERFVDYVRVKGAASPIDVTSRTPPRFRLPPQGPRPRAVVDPPEHLGGADVFSIPAVGRRRHARPERAAGDAEALANAARCAHRREISRLLAAPTLDDPLVFRDRAMLEIAYGAGLARFGMDQHRRPRRAVRGQAGSRVRQGKQGASGADRPLGDRRRRDVYPRAAATAREGRRERCSVS